MSYIRYSDKEIYVSVANWLQIKCLFNQKMLIVFLSFHENICCRYSLEKP